MHINKIPPAPFRRGSFITDQKSHLTNGWRILLLRMNFITDRKSYLTNGWIILLLRLNFITDQKSYLTNGWRILLLRMNFITDRKSHLTNGCRILLLRMNCITDRKSFLKTNCRFPLLRGLGGFVLLLLFSFNSFSQQDTIIPKRLKMVVSTGVIGYGGMMTGLYALWYKDVPSSSFHQFNDNKQWLQMDKIGHGVSSYYAGMVGYNALRWSGVSKNKSIWLGGTLGLFFLTSVEIYDGYSSEWGFSWGDVAFNTIGTTSFISQQLLWNEQRILLKYSYHKSNYVAINPSLLGENFAENILKDYNGQTYWASINIASFLGEKNKFPKWLNFAVGYGVDGLIGASENPSNFLIERQRQYYLSLDIDLTRIKTKSKFANLLLGAFGVIKFPMPTIGFYQKSGIQFYPVYF
jgi:uncharacterized protein YfiM (DUF2279 family)